MEKKAEVDDGWKNEDGKIHSESDKKKAGVDCAVTAKVRTPKSVHTLQE